ncbi:MAG: glycosyltransferase family 4 protein [Saprospiraceae bacterium]|uniref:Glycosyltransferase family 4 protein n=1 Tax=Candidatus Defluviibacterium haderslevense TaxID=2981993 RepID=A0A9D7SCT2_9BACT|nr:glycosyltransferase family 4 protein [Candidatus Defluviibacterium haderslevense]
MKQLKDEYNSNTHFTLLTSGALIERKGIDLTIKIVELLNKESENTYQLLVLGDGPLKKSLHEWSRELPINFLGFKQKEEIPYYFCIADAFLFCSRYDGWGLVINEAISAGLPCLVNKDVGSSELIENHVNGFICDNENLLSYVNAIEMLCKDKALIESIRTNNLQLSDQICSVSMADQLNQFLRENFNNS